MAKKLEVIVKVGDEAYSLQSTDFLHLTNAEHVGQSVEALITNLKATAVTDRLWLRG